MNKSKRMPRRSCQMFGIFAFTQPAKLSLQYSSLIVAMIIPATPLAEPRDRPGLEPETATYPPPLRCTAPRAPDSSTAQVATPCGLAGPDRRRDPHPTARGAGRRRALPRTGDERGG